MISNPINKDHHDHRSPENFLEQIATLTPVEIKNGKVTLIRSFVNVCLPGAASFDDENPGTDSPRAWQVIDDLIESSGVCGTFHTHPPLIMDFSDQDVRTQNGLAKANGAKLLWHGVRACNAPGICINNSYFVCCQMVNNIVFRHIIGSVEDCLSNPVVILPVPREISYSGSAICMSI